jgi:uncharacterized radical SAM superfamily protein
MDFYAPGLKRWQSSEWVPGTPRRFLPISVTGQACGLSCDHCEAKVLGGMVSVRAGGDLFELAARLHQEGTEGILVSGGSNRAGSVPLLSHLRHVPRIRSELGMRVVVHSGLVSPELARALAVSEVDGVMIDVVGADETLQEICHLDVGVAAVNRSLALLSGEGLRVIPHIVLGLHHGRLLGEHRALEMLAERALATLVLLVFVPLSGTAMAEVAPLGVEEVAAFFASARSSLPSAKINLGCARPLGRAKHDIDRAAIDLGLNGIAYPADGAIAYARSRGIEPRLFESCCSLTWDAAQQGPLREVRVQP